MELQINEFKKIDLNAPVKIVGRRAFNVAYQVFLLVGAEWVPGEAVTVYIEFPLNVYNDFQALTTKQKYRRALNYLFDDLDPFYLLTEEQKIINYINTISTDAELKANLIATLQAADALKL